MVIATKWGPMFKDGGIAMDGGRENCRRCCEGSLSRLGVSCVDVFTMRGPVDPKVPLEETMAEVKALVQVGAGCDRSAQCFCVSPAEVL